MRASFLANPCTIYRRGSSSAVDGCRESAILHRSAKSRRSQPSEGILTAPQHYDSATILPRAGIKGRNERRGSHLEIRSSPDPTTSLRIQSKSLTTSEDGSTRLRLGVLSLVATVRGTAKKRSGIPNPRELFPISLLLLVARKATSMKQGGRMFPAPADCSQQCHRFHLRPLSIRACWQNHEMECSSLRPDVLGRQHRLEQYHRRPYRAIPRIDTTAIHFRHIPRKPP